MIKNPNSFGSFLKEKSNGLPIWIWSLSPSLTIPIALLINSSVGYEKISLVDTVKFDILITSLTTYFWYKGWKKLKR